MARSALHLPPRVLVYSLLEMLSSVLYDEKIESNCDAVTRGVVVEYSAVQTCSGGNKYASWDYDRDIVKSSY